MDVHARLKSRSFPKDLREFELRQWFTFGIRDRRSNPQGIPISAVDFTFPCPIFQQTMSLCSSFEGSDRVRALRIALNSVQAVPLSLSMTQLEESDTNC
jgi:hypothetical protein